MEGLEVEQKALILLDEKMDFCGIIDLSKDKPELFMKR